MNCKYCSTMGNNPKQWEGQHASMQLFNWTNSPATLELEINPQYETTSYEASFEINYCPFCGRNLTQS